MGQMFMKTMLRIRPTVYSHPLIPFGYFILFFMCSLLIVCFLCLPIAGLFTSISIDNVYAAVLNPHFGQSLALSLLTSIISICLIVGLGTPLAYMMARTEFKGKPILDVLIDLPIVVPPSVAGIGLILAFGRRGMIGSYLDDMGITISFTTAAVVIAQVFIAAPFYIRAARQGFAGESSDIEAMARSLGATWWNSFTQITLPMAKPHLISGILTSWARALGEFGATIMFAGNFIGKTETLPLAIYSVMNENLGVAIVLANILLAMSLGLMLTVRFLSAKKGVL